MKVVAFLPAKGSSERVPNKNLQLLDGKPLFLRTLEKLLSCTFIDEVYLDSESDDIFRAASYLDFKPLRRDPALATNATDGHELFYNEVRQVDADIYIQVLCTSPFIEKETIRQGVEILKTDHCFDSVVLVKREKQYLWESQEPLYGRGRIPNSIDLAPITIETMGLYLVRKEVALQTRKRFGQKPYLLEAKPLEAIDVNIPEEFELANLIAAGKREKERKQFNNLRNTLSSALLSDILDNLGAASVVGNLAPNFPHAKILGRAKTLRLRSLQDGEDYRGIYDALKSYHWIVSNDVIVVENQIPQYAYFGELNAHLALRAGAVGAIVGGNTRDIAETIRLNFPVFATGTACRDVKGRATLAAINERVHLSGVPVLPDDLIFADKEGVVVIPKPLEAEVMKQAIEACRKEQNIRLGIALSADIDSLIETFGEF